MNKYLKYTFIILFLLFIGLYLSANAGLIDYQAKYKNKLTEKEIKRFEEDIKNNKDVSIEKYIDTNDKKYDNNVSKATLKVSNFLGEVVKNTLNFFFDNMEKTLDR